MPPDLSEKNLEATSEQVLTQAIPAPGHLDREAAEGARPWRLIHGSDGLLLSMLPVERRFG